MQRLLLLYLLLSISDASAGSFTIHTQNSKVYNCQNLHPQQKHFFCSNGRENLLATKDGSTWSGVSVSIDHSTLRLEHIIAVYDESHRITFSSPIVIKPGQQTLEERRLELFHIRSILEGHGSKNRNAPDLLKKLYQTVLAEDKNILHQLRRADLLTVQTTQKETFQCTRGHSISNEQCRLFRCSNSGTSQTQTQQHSSPNLQIFNIPPQFIIHFDAQGFSSPAVLDARPTSSSAQQVFLGQPSEQHLLYSAAQPSEGTSQPSTGSSQTQFEALQPTTSAHTGQGFGCDDQSINAYLDSLFPEGTAMNIEGSEDFAELMKEFQSEVNSILEPTLSCWAPTPLAKTREFVHPRRPSVKAQLSSAPITEEKAIKLMKKFNRIPSLAFNYTQDGCYARAHIMAYYLEKNGIQTEKIWLSGDLHHPDSPSFLWRYHVAPVIWITHQGENKRMVLDPALSPLPLTIEDWSIKMGATPATHPKVDEVTMQSYLAHTGASKPPRGITLSAGTAYMPGENPGQRFIKADVKKAQQINLKHWRSAEEKKGKWKEETCQQQKDFQFTGDTLKAIQDQGTGQPSYSLSLDQLICVIESVIQEHERQGLLN
jgi:hypothetical protein